MCRRQKTAQQTTKFDFFQRRHVLIKSVVLVEVHGVLIYLLEWSEVHIWFLKTPRK